MPTRITSISSLCLTLIVGVPASWSHDIQSAEDAEELCSTAPLQCGAPSDTAVEDPMLRAQRRRDYSLTRNRRLTDIYAILLDTHEYGFLPSEPGLLTIASMQPFLLFGGEYELELGSAPDLLFVLSEADSEMVLAGVASDQVLLRLHFHLVSFDDPGRDYCEVTDRGSTRIFGRLLAAELVARGEQAVLARIETERYEWGRVRFGIESTANYRPPRPSVRVTSSSFSTPDLPSAEAELLTMEAEAAMTPCYVRGLNQNGRLQGALVISYSIDMIGAVADPAVTIDAIDHAQVTGCVVNTMEQVVIARDTPGDPYDVRMTVIFRLE